MMPPVLVQLGVSHLASRQPRSGRATAPPRGGSQPVPSPIITTEGAVIFSALLGAWLGVRLPRVTTLDEFALLFLALFLLLICIRIFPAIRPFVFQLLFLAAVLIVCVAVGLKGATMGENWGLAGIFVFWLISEGIFSVSSLARLGRSQTDWRER